MSKPITAWEVKEGDTITINCLGKYRHSRYEMVNMRIEYVSKNHDSCKTTLIGSGKIFEDVSASQHITKHN